MITLVTQLHIRYLSRNSNEILTSRDQNYVEQDFVSLKTFRLLYCKIDMSFVASLVSCWGFSSQLGRRLARSSHQELEIPMKWLQLD
jgi:hypothetical protein